MFQLVPVQQECPLQQGGHVYVDRPVDKKLIFAYVTDRAVRDKLERRVNRGAKVVKPFNWKEGRSKHVPPRPVWKTLAVSINIF